MFVLSRLSVAVTAALLLIGAGLTWGVYRIETSRREVTFERLLVETAGYVETRIEPALLPSINTWPCVPWEAWPRCIQGMLPDLAQLLWTIAALRSPRGK